MHGKINQHIWMGQLNTVLLSGFELIVMHDWSVAFI